MTPEEIKSASDNELRVRLAQLRSMSRTQTVVRDKDIVESERYGAVANKLLDSDVPTAIEMMQKQSAINAKREEKQLSEQKKQEALNAVAKAEEMWRTNMADTQLQSAYRDAINRAKSLGVTPENALDDYAKEAYNAAIMGQRKDEFEANQQWRQNQFTYQAQQDAIDARQRDIQNGFEQQRIEIARDAANKAKSPTQEQTNNKLFGTRVMSAVNTMKQVIPTLSSSDKMQIVASLATGSDLAFSGTAATYMNALRDAVRAVLRKESGASIAPSEFSGGFDSYGFHKYGNESITASNLARLEQVGKTLLASSGADNTISPDNNSQNQTKPINVQQKKVASPIVTPSGQVID